MSNLIFLLHQLWGEASSRLVIARLALYMFIYVDESGSPLDFALSMRLLPKKNGEDRWDG